MVISKDDSVSRESRPKIVRSKSVGAVTRRIHGPMDARQHKKKPYTSTGNIRKRRDSCCLLLSPSVTNSDDIPRNQGISHRNCDLTDSSWSVSKTFPSTWDLENTCSVPTGRYERLQATTPPNHLEKPLPVESRTFRGDNSPKEIDYFSKSLVSLSAENLHQPLCLARGTMTDDRPAIFPGQLTGQWKQKRPQVMTKMTYSNSQEGKCKIKADSSSTGLAQMENFLASENNDTACQHKLDDLPSLIAHQYSNHCATRRTRRPLATCNLQDNQLNIQRKLLAGNIAESINVGQSEKCRHQHYTLQKMPSSGAKVSKTFSCDGTLTNETELTGFASPQDDWAEYDADEAVHSPIFRDECLDCTHQNTDQKNILTDDEARKLTDKINVPKCNIESNHQLSRSLRRQDTVLVQQDNIDDDDNADNGDFDSFFESLKKFLCQEISDDDILQEASPMEEDSDEPEVSYKNLLNYPPRYKCALCDSNLEVTPFRQYHGDCENEYFPFFTLEDSRSQTDLYCPQCRCLRSIDCPE